MTGLFRRIRRRPAEAPAPPPPPQADVPAGLDPVEPAPPASPSFRERGQLRRRLRYLRRVRELGFRDLGGLVFDQHRFARPNPDLLEAKLAALRAIDHELRALEVALDDRRALHELREPGIAACVRCGALHGSDANFCPSCGLQLSGPLALSAPGPGAAGFPVTAAGPPSGYPQPVAPFHQPPVADPQHATNHPQPAGPVPQPTAAYPQATMAHPHPAGVAPPEPPPRAPDPVVLPEPAPGAQERAHQTSGPPPSDQPTTAMPAVGKDGTGSTDP
jgi:hypothetical protein